MPNPTDEQLRQRNRTGTAIVARTTTSAGPESLRPPGGPTSTPLANRSIRDDLHAIDALVNSRDQHCSATGGPSGDAVKIITCSEAGSIGRDNTTTPTKFRSRYRHPIRVLTAPSDHTAEEAWTHCATKNQPRKPSPRCPVVNDHLAPQGFEVCS